MSIVSVLGANNEVVRLQFDTNVAIAQTLADQITQGVRDGSIKPARNNTTPFLHAGQIGEFVQTRSGSITLPTGYDAVVDNANHASITGSGDTDETILAGAGDLSFRAHTGSGTIVAGGGNDSVRIDRGDTDNWQINLGNGDDTINIQGGGSETISTGTGNDLLRLGTGSNRVTTGGPTTVLGGSGPATIFSGGDLTFFGGSGDAVVHGGQGGQDIFVAGTGNETLVGGSANRHGSDAFVFFKGAAGGDYMVQNFGLDDEIDLQGYSARDIANALSHAQHGPQGTSITLSDNTRITFSDVSKLNPANFIQS